MPIGTGLLNISFLGSLEAPTEQQDEMFPFLPKIDSIARAKVNPQFMETFTEGMTVAKVAQTDAIQTHSDEGSAFAIFQGMEPLGKGRSSFRREIFFYLIGKGFIHSHNVA
jgi:hypothetical protein